MLQNVDKRENLAELAAMVRYTVHAKKMKMRQLFDKRKEEKRIRDQYRNASLKKDAPSNLAQRVQAVNDYFRNKQKQKNQE